VHHKKEGQPATVCVRAYGEDKKIERTNQASRPLSYIRSNFLPANIFIVEAPLRPTGFIVCKNNLQKSDKSESNCKR